MSESASSECVWQPPPSDYRLCPGVVHVWYIDLRADRHDVSLLRGLLSEDEIARADRFLRAEHGQRFSLGRGALRSILGLYTGVDAQALGFIYNDFGKPALVAEHNHLSLVFNVSHTGTHAVVAVSLHASVGIDIERYRESLDLKKLAQRYFASAEVERLVALPESRREEAFYRCWSSKEAFIKLCGQGLSIGLQNFEVEVDPDRTPAILRAPGVLVSKGPWVCTAMPMEEGISGVLVVEGCLEQVRYYQYSI